MHTTRPRVLFFISALIFSILLNGSHIFGSFSYDVFGAAAKAQGAAGITRSYDALSMRNNPALMALCDTGGVSFGFARSAGLPELDEIAGGAVYSLSSRYGLALGASFITSGDSVWRESDYGASLSFAPFSGLAFGGTMRILELSIENICSLTLPAVDIGFLFQPVPSLRLAGSAYALNQPKTGKGKNDRVLSSFRIACAYEALPGFVLSHGYMIDDFGLSPSFGAEYALFPALILRSGFETASSQLTLGLGLAIARYKADISTRLPLDGGEMSHAFTLTWSWGSALDGGMGRRVGFAPLNINTASERELSALPGVSTRLAERIVRERNERKFYAVHDVYRVSGVSCALMKKAGQELAVSDTGGKYLVLKTAEGKECHINAYGIRELAALGIRADTARRIVLLRKNLRGFARIEDLSLMPNGETNWIPLVLESKP